LGAYYLTIEPRTKPAKGVRVPLLSGLQEVLYVKADGALKMHDWIEVPNPDFKKDTVYGNKERKVLRTTVGRVIFNEIWPPALGFINFPVPKGKLGDLILNTYKVAGDRVTVETLDRLKELGFQTAMQAGISIGIDDMIIPENKKEIVHDARKKVDEEMMEDEDEEDEMMPMRPAASGMAPDLEAARMKRLRSLGTKSADIGLNGFMCAIERKVYPGSISVCDDCPGGCVAEKGLPGLLHVEGLAETMFKGDVIDSGYSSEADMFVVDVQTKSGYVNEVFIDGTTAEVLGFHRLDDSIFEQKSLMDDIELVDLNEAAEIAVKSVPGTVMAVEPSVFEGFDAYQVEVDGFDSKSYDVYVALDGEVLGWDKWEPDDVDEIEAEAAEISLKRAFTEETRQKMAEDGEAMEDGSFPIAGEEDLRNAIMAHGRAKDIPAVKRFIMKRAMELGMEKMIPAEWAAGEKNLSVEGDSGGEFLKSLVEFELLQTEVGDDK
jgi:uncharacterized membrane protein YkoI